MRAGSVCSERRRLPATGPVGRRGTGEGCRKPGHPRRARPRRRRDTAAPARRGTFDAARRRPGGPPPTAPPGAGGSFAATRGTARRRPGTRGPREQAVCCWGSWTSSRVEWTSAPGAAAAAASDVAVNDRQTLRTRAWTAGQVATTSRTTHRPVTSKTATSPPIAVRPTPATSPISIILGRSRVSVASMAAAALATMIARSSAALIGPTQPQRATAQTRPTATVTCAHTVHTLVAPDLIRKRRRGPSPDRELDPIILVLPRWSASAHPLSFDDDDMIQRSARHRLIRDGRCSESRSGPGHVRLAGWLESPPLGEALERGGGEHGRDRSGRSRMENRHDQRA